MFRRARYRNLDTICYDIIFGENKLSAFLQNIELRFDACFFQNRINLTVSKLHFYEKITLSQAFIN